MLRGGYAAAGAIVALGAIISPVVARQVRDEAVGEQACRRSAGGGRAHRRRRRQPGPGGPRRAAQPVPGTGAALCDRRTGQLRHQALHDALTGLPNRALVQDRAEQMLARSQRSATRCAALFIGLDRFKDVNDTLGRGAGDELLKEAGARLSGILRGPTPSAASAVTSSSCWSRAPTT